MNANPSNILPLAVRNCRTLSTIQMYFNFIDRRHSENSNSEASIESAEGYLSEIQHYVDTCTKYQHLHATVVIAQRYLSVSTLMLIQMKGG